MSSRNTKTSIDQPVISVSGLEVDVVRKDIKNLHVAVYPPFGRVRVAAPEALDQEAVRLAVVSRLPWIRKQRKQILDQERQSRREMVDGETHYVWGRKYRLRVIEGRGPINLTPDGWLELPVQKRADRDARERKLDRWYREQMRDEIPNLISKWVPVLDVPEPDWHIRRMKTKWGTCKPDKQTIWLNSELAKKPHECLEYITVHEMIHLLERTHSERFYELQDRFLPAWRSQRETLNAYPLADENWTH